MSVLHVPCTSCGAQRFHLGVGVCWACMSEAQRERFGAQDTRKLLAVRVRPSRDNRTHLPA